MSAQHTPERLTLRKLIELVGPDFLDAELSVTVSGATGRNSVWVPLPTDLYAMPRVEANPRTGEPARLTFSMRTSDVRFVKATGRGS
ncbi:hypothetical protein ACGLHS_31650 [Variovorax sp. VaC1]|uniref:hypothetical protein n=1 Tax=Variovorax sp. VaC1 TaxID=3373132 RepID=UPI00374911C9